MRSLNRCIVTGHLGKDPETTPAGSSTVTKFSLAVNDRWKDDAGEKQERVNWLQIAVFNGNGGNVSPYLKKGAHVLVEGSLRTSEWDDKQTGQKRYGFEIIASQVLFLTPKGEPKQAKLKKVK